MISEHGDMNRHASDPPNAHTLGRGNGQLGAAVGGDAPLAPTRVSLDFQFPSDVRYIERVIELVRQQCEQLAFPPRKCSLNVPVALAEALSNAILRGNGEDLAKKVRVHVQVDSSALVLEVVDEGAGFDLDSCTRNPGDPANLEEENGRGLYLMRRLMDSVERYTDGGNVVRLTLLR